MWVSIFVKPLDGLPEQKFLLILSTVIICEM